MMPHDLEDYLDDLVTWIRGGRTPEKASLALARTFGNDLAAATLKEYYRRTQQYITLTHPHVLVGSRRMETWYNGPDFDGAWCWPAYKQLLHDRGWTEELPSVDEATTKILAHLPHPSEPTFATRGLVLGYVQSGKTANFAGLIAKAADAGYKLFIVLSGTTSSLRQQTQDRLESELRFANQQTQLNWFLLTDSKQDFRGMAIGNPNALLNPQNVQMRILCVVKKNTRILQRLTEFLSKTTKTVLDNCPVLVIDDEADQASINTRHKANERSAINRDIVKMLSVLPKAALVGYTATPFANLFIDPALPEDLYPRDFIFDLPKPPRYFGAERIFGRDVLLGEAEPDDEFSGLDVIREIKEDEIPLVRCAKASERQKFQPELVPSLEYAIQYFLIATAVRLVRGHKAHSSMLVHTTLYVDVHDRLASLINDHLKQLQTQVRLNKHTLFTQFESVWNEERNRVPGSKEESFVPIADKLVEVLERCLVVVDNGRKRHDEDGRVQGLNYEVGEGEQHKFLIAVGGNTLSRGLTLEGLVVSYFVRPANAYDTLLQMGRWFGYRNGYEDLPRVWMTSDLEEDFYHLATVEAELREDVKRYEREGVTPLEFGVRVRTHPKLAVTARVKMPNVKITSISYSEEHIQTFLFKHEDQEWLTKNIDATQAFLKRLGSPVVSEANSQKPSTFTRQLFTGVSVGEVLEFLRAYNVVDDHRDFRFDLLEAYIRKENATGSLKHWNVGVFGSGKANAFLELGCGEIGCVNRSRFGGGKHANIKALTGSRERVFDLQLPEVTSSNRDYIFALREKHAPGVGFLMIYPIDQNSRSSGADRTDLKAATHMIGIGLMFPKSKLKHEEYVINDFQFFENGEGLDEVVPEESDELTILPQDDQEL